MLFLKRAGIGILALIALWAGLNILKSVVRYVFHPSVERAVDSDWSTWSGGSEALRYSELGQISPKNVSYLRQEWTYRTGELELYDTQQQRKGVTFQATPIFIPLEDGPVLAFCTGSNRVIALDAVTGEQRWIVTPEVSLQQPGSYSCRGVAWHRNEQAPDGQVCRDRIIAGTQELDIMAIDAQTGQMCTEFGEQGVVKVDPGIELEVEGETTFKSPPTVAGDIIVMGSMIRDMNRVRAPSGVVRAFDVFTGERRWEFYPLATDPDDPASLTWAGDSAQNRGGGNAWAAISYDPELNMVYVPTSAPSVDMYGGDRHGDNLYTNSVVALSADKGEIQWHFQMVRHDLWDYDLASESALLDLNVDGVTRKALVQPTKMGLTFVLDRETGEPIHPVEYRSVPASTVPGEEAADTQPFPTVIPPLDPMTLDKDDMWGPLTIGRNDCKKQLEAILHDGPYVPPSEQGSLFFPSPLGGVNWGGVSINPETKIMVANSSRVATIAKLNFRTGEPSPLADEKDIKLEEPTVRPQKGVPYEASVMPFLGPMGTPCNAPPWGLLTAINLESGEVLWEKPFGTIKQQALFPIRLGTPNLGGSVTTKSGLTFIAATMDQRFHAFDMNTGKLLWYDDMPAGGQASPMTYSVDGKQYVVIAAGGHFALQAKLGDHLIAYALPDRIIKD